jgi:multisubunit Na+/H+ antiporter MnhB subunit
MSRRNIIGALFFTVVTIFFLFSVLQVIQFGTPSQSEMDDYIIDNCQQETGANNGVTSVVFDYRGFDTLGEATILFTAVAGVIMIFRRLLHD